MTRSKTFFFQPCAVPLTSGIFASLHKRLVCPRRLVYCCRQLWKISLCSWQALWHFDLPSYCWLKDTATWCQKYPACLPSVNLRPCPSSFLNTAITCCAEQMERHPHRVWQMIVKVTYFCVFSLQPDAFICVGRWQFCS